MPEFYHRFTRDDPAAYRQSAAWVNRCIALHRIVNAFTKEQRLVLERQKYRIVTRKAKLAFTVLIADAARRALRDYPICPCGRHDFCAREQLAAIVPRLVHNAESVLPLIERYAEEGARDGTHAGSEGP